MTHLFKKITNNDFGIEGPALIVKNITSGPFEVDEDGRVLHSMGVAAVDDQCPICKSGIDSGKLIILKAIKGSKNKTKNISLSNDEVTQTVASEEHNDSVQ